ALGSMCLRMSQAHAIRSTPTFSHVTHFIDLPVLLPPIKFFARFALAQNERNHATAPAGSVWKGPTDQGSSFSIEQESRHTPYPQVVRTVAGLTGLGFPRPHRPSTGSLPHPVPRFPLPAIETARA